MQSRPRFLRPKHLSIPPDRPATHAVHRPFASLRLTYYGEDAEAFVTPKPASNGNLFSKKASK